MMARMNTRHARPFLLLAFLIAGAVPLARLEAANQVHVVDPVGGTGLHATIQAAVDAATDGDVVLVRPGSYGSFHMTGKGVSVIADSGAGGARPVVEHVSVGALAVGQRATVRGLRIDQTPSLFSPVEALLVAGCKGPVVIEDCVVRGGVDHGASVTGSTNTLFVRCDIEALDGSGLFVSVSTIHVVDSIVVGGPGSNAVQSGNVTIPAQPGMPAIWLAASFLYVAGGATVGGQGGTGITTLNGVCSPGADGGPALFVFGPLSPQAFHFDATLVGGAGGLPAPGCANGGQPGAAVKIQDGTVHALSGALRTVAATSPIREGAVAQLDVEGQPGEAVALLVGPVPTIEFLEMSSGTLLPKTFFVVPLGPLSPTGTLTATVPVPAASLPPGVDVREAFVQVLALGPAGQPVLGSGTVVAVVDGAL